MDQLWVTQGDEDAEFFKAFFCNNFLVGDRISEEMRKSGVADKMLDFVNYSDFAKNFMRDFIEHRNYLVRRKTFKPKDPRRDKIEGIIQRYCSSVIQHHGPCVSVTSDLSKCVDECLDEIDSANK